MKAASRLVPFLQVLGSSLRNNRFTQFKRILRNGLSAVIGQTTRNVGSGLSLPMLTSAGSRALLVANGEQQTWCTVGAQ
jgi:hypothetical protein